jgi:CRISPR-associated protein Cas1
MRKLQNTLYVSSQCGLSVEGENIILTSDGKVLGRVPLHNLDSIYCFNRVYITSPLMAKCGKYQIDINLFSVTGKLESRIVSPQHGNVLLRIEQASLAEEKRLSIAKNMIFAKLYNSKWVLERCCRDHSLSIDIDKVKNASLQISLMAKETRKAQSHDQLRGLEGKAAAAYFKVFDELIINQKEDFSFSGRSRRPPMDRINALLSFIYSMLTTQLSGACEAVGLDPFVGVNHVLRPGRPALALDLIEELRPSLADRFCLTLINQKQIQSSDFIIKENGSCFLTDDGRKKVLNAWQQRKQQELKHPYLEEKIPWGLVPYIQAKLLASVIRGDLDEYPPLLWK